MKKIQYLIILASIGCCTSPKPYDPPPQSYKTAYLIHGDPENITVDLNEVVSFKEERLREYSEVFGILWEAIRSDPTLDDPDLYDTGGDTAIFSGFLLAARSWKYGVTGNLQDLEEALRTLDGLYLLTHTAGPGVIARCAFPKDQAYKWQYPEVWQHRIDNGFVGEGKPLSTPRGASFPETIYYTRGTKDQLTGILFGLTVAWTVLDDPVSKMTIAVITHDLLKHIQKFNWLIRDYNGKNDTNADKVNGLQRTQLLALYKHTSKVYGDADADDLYNRYRQISDSGDFFGWGNNYEQYFAWNLRFTRAFTVWLLENDTDAKHYVERWLWPHTKDHQNPWFELVNNVMTGVPVESHNLMVALQSTALRSHRSWGSPYADQERKPSIFNVMLKCTKDWVLPPHLRKPATFLWSKEPWDTGSYDSNGTYDDNGLSLLLPYWGVQYFKNR